MFRNFYQSHTLHNHYFVSVTLPWYSNTGNSCQSSFGRCWAIKCKTISFWHPCCSHIPTHRSRKNGSQFGKWDNPKSTWTQHNTTDFLSDQIPRKTQLGMANTNTIPISSTIAKEQVKNYCLISFANCAKSRFKNVSVYPNHSSNSVCMLSQMCSKSAVAPNGTVVLCWRQNWITLLSLQNTMAGWRHDNCECQVCLQYLFAMGKYLEHSVPSHAQ